MTAQPIRSKSTGTRLSIGMLTNEARVLASKMGTSGWGIVVEGAGLSSVAQPSPVRIEWYQDSLNINQLETGYASVKKIGSGLLATATIKTPKADFVVEDSWSAKGDVLSLSRKVTVKGDAAGGFGSGITLIPAKSTLRREINFFAPGVMYGSSAHLTDVAIGGSKGGNTIYIREDRLPAPMFGLHFKDGSSVTVLDAAPKGGTTTEDSRDQAARTLIDERFQFGAMGAEEKSGNVHFGFWWPGSEGETTYKGKMYPGGQLHQWRRRYHPVKNGLVQQYQVAFRFAQKEEFPAYYTQAWRWAWNTLKPPVTPQNIELVRRSLVDMLGERIETRNGLTGITNWNQAVESLKHQIDRQTILGFTGKALETAYYLLQDGDLNKTPNGEKHRQQGTAIFNSFTKLKMNPPVGEGFNLDTGEPAIAIPHDKQIYLRSFGDDMKTTAQTILRERKLNREHPDWLQWVTSFADWLLTQQRPNGGFPRSWKPGTGEVADTSQLSTYEAVPFLLLMTQVTNNPTYRQAALEAGEFSWKGNQQQGIFVGGTIDNPDVIDKEAGILSAEAYLALYDLTKEKKWLHRARAAANYAETWIYCWNVPMPTDVNDPDIGWKPGISTVGLQLISSGHSLADAFMTYNVDEYAKLFLLTGDSHYREVARILLHNTKNMLALPGRTYDLRGPGWQQEHWSLAPVRGYGIYRGWLPWVSTSHLNGIFGLEELDVALFKELAGEGGNE